MDIGNRLRSVREEKKLSQGDIEQRTGLLFCYISVVCNDSLSRDTIKYDYPK
jgi:transcriptional regulator with XRE-family HTH domain